METNNDTRSKIFTPKNSPKLHKQIIPQSMRHGLSFNSYNFKPSYLPSIGVPQHHFKDINTPPLSRIEQNSLFLQSHQNGHELGSGEKFVNYTQESPSPPLLLKSKFVNFSQRQNSFNSFNSDNESDNSSFNLTRAEHNDPIIQMSGGGGGGAGVERVLIVDNNGADKHYDLEDIEAKLPEKASLKNSLKIEDKILRLNIGGASYRIRMRSILRYGPTTLLGRFCVMDHEHKRLWADAFFEESQEYFFERVPRYFDPIYDFYAAGKLHVPKDLCFDKFMSELRFWSVSKAKMDDCCSPFAQFCIMRKSSTDQPEKDHFIGLKCATIRRRLWLILEGHSHSKWWKLFEITSTSFVVLSIAALILSSMPEFQVLEYAKTGHSHSNAASINYPTFPKVDGYTVSTTTVIKNGEETKPEMIEHPVFNIVENMCVVYFTVEYLLRFWVAPQKLVFVKEFLNVIDLLAIAPFVFEIILILIGIRGDNIRKVRWAFLTVRLLRVLRVVRIAKLGRFSPGLANFALTLRKSKKQMQMVAIVLLTVIIFFSTLVYFLERDEPNTKFTSIPAAFWWCLFSQTKWVPQTAIGKIVGGGAIICGVLVLALPIAIIVNNFMQVVKLREEKIIKQYAQCHGDHV